MRELTFSEVEEVSGGWDAGAFGGFVFAGGVGGGMTAGYAAAVAMAPILPALIPGIAVGALVGGAAYLAREAWANF